MSLNFMTLYARNVDETATLYRLLGMEFVTERHESGPVHLAAEMAGFALEIYPGEDVGCPGLLLGFEVADLHVFRERLIEAEIRIQSDISECQGIRRLIALDADGRRALVTQSSLRVVAQLAFEA